MLHTKNESLLSKFFAPEQPSDPVKLVRIIPLSKPEPEKNSLKEREVVDTARNDAGRTQAEVRRDTGISIRKGAFGPDVKILQSKIGTDDDGKFGVNTENAVKLAQKSKKLPETGIVDDALLRALGIYDAVKNAQKQNTTPVKTSLPIPRPEVLYSKTTDEVSPKAREVIQDLQTVDFFLNAHNKTYGEKDSIISNRNGIVGIVWQLSSPDSSNLARELGITDERLKAYAESLHLENTKVKEGLIRMAIIAVVSGLISGGSSLALEILGINYKKDYKKGPEMSKILELMGRKGNLTEKRRDILMDPRTTSKDVEVIGQVLRSDNLLPANIRSDVVKIVSSDFFLFDFLADIFGNSDKEQMDVLIKQFQTARNLDEAEVILTQIVGVATDKYYEKYGSGKANDTLASLANSLKTIRDLKAKNDKILGRKFDQKRYDRDTARVQVILDATYGKPEAIKGFPEAVINIGQSYAPPIPKNLNPATLGDMLQKMANTNVKGDKYSMLANLMRGVNFHTGISFKPDEFLEAFKNMRLLNAQERKDFNRTILSNTGRQRNQNFNGLNLVDGVTVIELNGQKVYFREKCTNVLTVINDIPTTVEMSRSLPVVIPISTGLPGWGGGPGGQGSTPGVRDGGTDSAGGNGMPNVTDFGR